MLKNLTTGDAVVINVFNHTVMQGEKGISATVDLPPIYGEIVPYHNIQLAYKATYVSEPDSTHSEHVLIVR